MTIDQRLASLRSRGWKLSQANDYVEDATGRNMVYWSFTRGDGFGAWVEGNGVTDHDALDAIEWELGRS